MQEEPRLGGDVVREEQCLAPELEREGGSIYPTRERDSAGAVVVVAHIGRALGLRYVDLGTTSVRYDPARRARRKVPEVDARLANPEPVVELARLPVRLYLCSREPREAHSVGVGKTVVAPCPGAADPADVQLASARQCQLPPSVHRDDVIRWLFRLVVGRLGDELAHPRLEQRGVPDRDLGEPCPNTGDVVRTETPGRRIRLDVDLVEP